MSRSLLEVTDLKKHFAQKKQLIGKALPPIRAVDGVSLTLESNSVLGLVGESGCGKSTLRNNLPPWEQSQLPKRGSLPIHTMAT